MPFSPRGSTQEGIGSSIDTITNTTADTTAIDLIEESTGVEVFESIIVTTTVVITALRVIDGVTNATDGTIRTTTDMTVMIDAIAVTADATNATTSAAIATNPRPRLHPIHRVFGTAGIPEVRAREESQTTLAAGFSIESPAARLVAHSRDESRPMSRT